MSSPPASLETQKATLRATALAARDALSGERRAAAAQAIALRGLPFEIMPGAVGLGMLGLASLLAPEALAAQREPHFAPRAKRVIHLFMNGGPFGPDLLDPKPAINR